MSIYIEDYANILPDEKLNVFVSFIDNVLMKVDSTISSLILAKQSLADESPAYILQRRKKLYRLKILREHNKELVHEYDDKIDLLIDAFKQKIKVEIPCDKDNLVVIPKYNYNWERNSCHFNSMLQLFSSLSFVLNKLQQNTNKDEKGKILFEALIAPHFKQLISTVSSYAVSQELNMPLMHEGGWSNDDLKYLTQILWKNGVSKNILFVYTGSLDLLEEDEKDKNISQLLYKYQPIYFITDIQVFNLSMNIEDSRANCLNYLAFSVDGKIEYSLSAITIDLIPNVKTVIKSRAIGHVVCGFVAPNEPVENQKFIIRDDMKPTLGDNTATKISFDSTSIYQNCSTACYVRIT